MSFRNSAHTRINSIIPLNDLYIEEKSHINIFSFILEHCDFLIFYKEGLLIG